MVGDISTPMSFENIQLKLRQKINIKGSFITGSSLFPNGRMEFSCCKANTVSFINKEGVELFQIGKDKTVLMIQFILMIKITLLYHLEGEIIYI